MVGFQSRIYNSIGIQNVSIQHINIITINCLRYKEVIEPGYNFNAKDLITKSNGTSHFTQVIWKDSIHFGIAHAEGSLWGEDGGLKRKCAFVVARYSPGGNVPGEYQENVLPPIDGKWLSEFEKAYSNGELYKILGKKEKD